MGSITFTMVGDGSVGTKTKTFTVADADINRIVAYLKGRFATEANPSPSTAQAALAWANAAMADLRGGTMNRELQTGRDAVAVSDLLAT